MTQIFLGLGLAIAVFIGVQVAYKGGQLDSTYDNKDREQIVEMQKLIDRISKQRDDAITGWEKTNLDWSHTTKNLEKANQTIEELLKSSNR